MGFFENRYRKIVPDFALAVLAGISEVAAAHGAALLGGNVSRSTGPLMVDITVVGEPGTRISRVGARPGDELWVTGKTPGSGWERIDALNTGAESVRLWVFPGERLWLSFFRPGSGLSYIELH